MAFSILRPKSLGSYAGDHKQTLDDHYVKNKKFEIILSEVNIRNNLTKTKFQYFTFLNEEGSKSIIDYLEERVSVKR